MGTIKKCVITRYDDSITEPPFKTIPVGSVEVCKPDNDEYGKEFAERLRAGCRMHGHLFKCYTTSVDKEYDFEVIVY